MCNAIPRGLSTCNVKRFRGGLVFKAHRLLYHSTLGLRVIKKKKKSAFEPGHDRPPGAWQEKLRVLGFGLWRVLGFEHLEGFGVLAC